ncbi:MAG: calcium-binding protein, partial [Pseudomonadota bacterium]
LAARSYALAAGQEIETLATVNDAGPGFINLTGNEFANTLRGNAGGNRLNGGLGSDTLTGLAGADTFVFDTALGGGNADTITDFVHGTDRIELDQSIFSSLGLGTLGASAFGTGPATTADQRILYDAVTGALSYDADGSGSGAAIIFATLSTHPATITNTDFFVVA